MATKQTKVFRFNSLGEFVKATAERNPVNAAARRHGRQQHGSKVDMGTDTFKEAVGLTETGWPEGGEKIRRIREGLQAKVEQVVFERMEETRFGVEGEWADMGRMLEGHPECMGYDEEGDDAGERIVRIVANSAISWVVSAETIFQRGAAVAAAVDVLEATGTRVELWVAAGSSPYGKGSDIEVQTCIKKPQEPVDLDALAYALANASYQRRLTWNLLESEGQDMGYSRPAPIENFEGDAVLLPELIAGSKSISTAVREDFEKICELCGINKR